MNFASPPASSEPASSVGCLQGFHHLVDDQLSSIDSTMDEIKEHGWTAQPRDPAAVLKGQKNIEDPQPQLVENIDLPDSPLAKAITEYAKRELPEQTFNHSMRVYYYGTTMS